MLPCTLQVETNHTPASLIDALRGEPGRVLLHSALHDPVQARFSFVTARPFLTFTSWATRCEVNSGGRMQTHFGNPWHLLDPLLAKYELLDEPDLPFPSTLSDEEVVNALSQYLDLQPIERQALLERPGVAARCEGLIDLLEMRSLVDGHPSDRGLVH